MLIKLFNIIGDETLPCHPSETILLWYLNHVTWIEYHITISLMNMSKKFLSKILTNQFNIISIICVYVYVHDIRIYNMHVSDVEYCVGQRTSLWSHLSPSPCMWVPGIEPRLPGLRSNFLYPSRYFDGTLRVKFKNTLRRSGNLLHGSDCLSLIQRTHVKAEGKRLLNMFDLHVCYTLQALIVTHREDHTQ